MFALDFSLFPQFDSFLRENADFSIGEFFSVLNFLSSSRASIKFLTILAENLKCRSFACGLFWKLCQNFTLKKILEFPHIVGYFPYHAIFFRLEVDKVLKNEFVRKVLLKKLELWQDRCTNLADLCGSL